MSRAGRGADEGAAGRILIIGIGNALRSDDGVGPRVATLLVDDPRLRGVEVLARHQLTPELAVDMAAASLLVLLDAGVDGAPGEISVRRVEAANEAADDPPGLGATSHHVGVDELLGLAEELGGHRPRAVVVSIGVASMEVGEGLSPAVAAALPAVVEVVAKLITDRGEDPS